MSKRVVGGRLAEAAMVRRSNVVFFSCAMFANTVALALQQRVFYTPVGLTGERTDREGAGH